MRIVLTLVLVPRLLAACASSGPVAAGGPEPVVSVPTRTLIDNDFSSQPASVRDTVVAESRQRIWAALPYVFQALGVETSTLDERSLVMGNDGWRPSAIHGTRLSSFLECGRGIVGPNADSYDVTMVLLVQLEPRGPSSTLLRIVMDADARPRSASGAAIQCATQGTLEMRIVRLLGEALAGAGEGGYALSTPGSPVSVSGRLPTLDEFVRVGCAPPGGAEARVAEGTFKGTSDGALLMEVGAERESVAVPVPSVSTIQIREGRSRVRIGAVIGALLGGAAGGYQGRALYNPDATYHYTRGATTVIGGVLGAIGGALVGAIAGSLFDYDVWVDATPAWQARLGTAASVPADALGLPAPGCAAAGAETGPGT